MDQQEFQHSVTAELRRDLAIGRATEELRRAQAKLDGFPPMFCGARSTARMLAFGDVAFWQAKKLQAERGL